MTIDIEAARCSLQQAQPLRKLVFVAGSVLAFEPGVLVRQPLHDAPRVVAHVDALQQLGHLGSNVAGHRASAALQAGGSHLVI